MSSTEEVGASLSKAILMAMGDIFAEARLFRVGVSGENREGTVNLFGEHDAGKFVRHGESGERDFLFGASAQFRWKSSGIAAEKHQFSDTTIAQVAEPFRELL